MTQTSETCRSCYVKTKEEEQTDGGFTELLVSHLVGDVGPHQDADLDLQLLSDDVGDELQSIWTFINALETDNTPFSSSTSGLDPFQTTALPYFDEGYPDGSLRHMRLHLVAEFANELVRDDEDEDLGSLHGFSYVGNSHLETVSH